MDTQQRECEEAAWVEEMKQQLPPILNRMIDYFEEFDGEGRVRYWALVLAEIVVAAESYDEDDAHRLLQCMGSIARNIPFTDLTPENRERFKQIANTDPEWADLTA